MKTDNLITLNEYAARHGLLPNTVRYKCIRGTLPGSVKIGRDWFIPSNQPYTDNRIKSGEYKNWRKKAPAE